MRVLLLSKYGRLGASSRLRSYQYIPFLKASGVRVDVLPLFDSSYIESKYAGSSTVKKVLFAYTKRIVALFRAHGYDLIWIEKELFPWVPLYFERFFVKGDRPVMIDYDDAVFHRYDQHPWRPVQLILEDKIDRLIAAASGVVVGSEYLACRARHAGAKKLLKLPTVVDLENYVYQAPVDSSGTVTIGWIGTPVTAKYLLPLVPVFADLQSVRDIKIVAVGAPALPEFVGVIETVPWSEHAEGRLLAGIDIGIMPLPNEPFERGKCAYKLIQYMASGKPVVASPVGENSEVVDDGANGFLSDSRDEWRSSLLALCDNPKLREQFGLEGRRLVQESYSLENAAPQFLTFINEVCS